MRMTARYRGKCRSCGAPIAEGEPMDYDTNKGGAACEDCANEEHSEESGGAPAPSEELAGKLGFKWRD